MTRIKFAIAITLGLVAAALFDGTKAINGNLSQTHIPPYDTGEAVGH
jgi:hypothetical protein